MPACARKEIVRPGQPGVFHCWARCVRRAFLLGNDPLTGNDYSHRREWVLERLSLLVSCFAIDVGFFATMSNHLHLVLRAEPRLTQRMSRHEVARRWLRVFPGTRVLDGNWIEPTPEQIDELARDRKQIKRIRKRLSNISWFMGALSEYVARKANCEDRATGRFWEGRFQCRELDSEQAILVCGIYVDLNQIRAGEVASPEESLHTSLGCRLDEGSDVIDWLAPLTLEADHLGEMPSGTGRRASDKGLLPMSLEDYRRLLMLTAEQDGRERTECPPPDVARQLDELGVNPELFYGTVLGFPGTFKRMVAREERMRERAEQCGRRWMHGVDQAAAVFR